jgi:hypothetical protein
LPGIRCCAISRDTCGLCRVWCARQWPQPQRASRHRHGTSPPNRENSQSYLRVAPEYYAPTTAACPSTVWFCWAACWAKFQRASSDLPLGCDGGEQTRQTIDSRCLGVCAGVVGEVGAGGEADVRAVLADPNADWSDDVAKLGVLAGAVQAVHQREPTPRPGKRLSHLVIVDLARS